jgi:phage terminase small subunit
MTSKYIARPYLTDKQEAFAKHIAAGYNVARATVLAGYSDKTRVALAVRGSQLLKNARVRTSIDYWRAFLLKEASARQAVLETLIGYGLVPDARLATEVELEEIKTEQHRIVDAIAAWGPRVAQNVALNGILAYLQTLAALQGAPVAAEA